MFICNLESIYIFNNLKVIGYSDSELCSITLKPFNICFNCGYDNMCAKSIILLSNSTTNCINNLYKCLPKNIKCEVLLNENYIDIYHNYLNNYEQLNTGKKKKEFSNWKPMSTDIYNTYIYNKAFTIKRYKLSYDICSYAYGVDYISYKLKPEYINTEIKENDEIMDNKIVKICLFIYQTSNTCLYKLPFNEYKNIIIECVYFEEYEVYTANLKKRLHIKDLEPLFEKYPNNYFYLHGFRNTIPLQSIVFYKKIYEEKYNNIRFLVSV